MKFKTHYNDPNQDQVTGYYEHNMLPSETVPDQTLTVKEIYTRYAQGRPLGAGMHELAYEGLEPSLPINWATMDISERHDFAAEHKIKLTELNKQLKEKKEQEETDELRETLRTEILLQMEADKNPATDLKQQKE